MQMNPGVWLQLLAQIGKLNRRYVDDIQSVPGPQDTHHPLGEIPINARHLQETLPLAPGELL